MNLTAMALFLAAFNMGGVGEVRLETHDFERLSTIAPYVHVHSPATGRWAAMLKPGVPVLAKVGWTPRPERGKYRPAKSGESALQGIPEGPASSGSSSVPRPPEKAERSPERPD